MDFLEVPSMLAQQWVYEPACLARLANAHPETGASLPVATIKALADAKVRVAQGSLSRF